MRALMPRQFKHLDQPDMTNKWWTWTWAWWAEPKAPPLSLCTKNPPRNCRIQAIPLDLAWRLLSLFKASPIVAQDQQVASKLDIVVHGPQGPKSPPRFQVDLLFLILALFLCAATRPTFIIVNPQRLSVFKASKDVYITPFYPDPLSLQYSLKLLQRGSFLTFSAWKQAGPCEALQGKNPFLFVGNWHYTASQTLGSSKGKIQTVANQVREGMQKQRRSNQGTIEQPWGRVPVPSQGIYISNIFEFFSGNWGPTQVKDGHFRLSTRFLGTCPVTSPPTNQKKVTPPASLAPSFACKKTSLPKTIREFVFCFLFFLAQATYSSCMALQ